MRFDMRYPCDQCPFSLLPGAVRLNRERAEEIHTQVTEGDGSFSCHKTAVYDDDEDEEGSIGPNTQHCAGALLYLEGIDRPNQLMRIMGRLGLYDPAKLIPCPTISGPDDMVGDWER